LTVGGLRGATTLVSQMIPILTGRGRHPAGTKPSECSPLPRPRHGYDDRKGQLEPGKEADLAIFHDDWTAWRTLIGGRWVYAS